MKWRNTASGYGLVALSLHWVIVAAIVAQYFLAEAAEEQDGGPAGLLSPANLHDSLGIAILALACMRLLWRVIEPAPAHPVAMKRYETVLARAVHVAFYVLLFAIPLSGWALVTAEGRSLNFFGLLDLPGLQIAGTLTEDRLEEVHEILFNVLLGLALLHVAAAVKHHFVDRDGVLRSMLPQRVRKPAR